jgi:hypothetical protein
VDLTSSERPLAKVIPLSGPRSCFNCCAFDEKEDPDDWGVMSYCTIYDEFIDSELYAAEHCPSYQPE